MTEETVVIDSVSAIVRATASAPRAAWYRGQASRWPALPKMLRPDISGAVRREQAARMESAQGLLPGQLTALFEQEEDGQIRAEQSLNDEFLRSAAAMLPTGCSYTELYFLAQHYGLPTRLLDWTAYPLAGC